MNELICLVDVKNRFRIDFKNLKNKEMIFQFDKIKILELYNVGINKKVKIQANTITNLIINSFVNFDLLNDFINKLDNIKIGNLILKNKKKKNKFISEVILSNKEKDNMNNKNEYCEINIFNNNIKNIRITGNIILKKLPKEIGELEFIDGNILTDSKFKEEIPDNIYNLSLKNINLENESVLYCLIKKVKNQLVLEGITIKNLDTSNNIVPIDVISIKDSNIENLKIEETTKLTIKFSNIKNSELKLHTLSIRNSTIDNIKGNIKNVEIYFDEKNEIQQYVKKHTIFFEILTLLEKLKNISGLEKIKFKFKVFSDYYVYKKIENELNKTFNNIKNVSLLKLYTQFFLNNSLYLKKEGFIVPGGIVDVLNKTIAYKTIII